MQLKKQEQRYKEYLRLLEADRKNHEAQMALGYVELDKPIPRGWDVIVIPRADIQNREDAWIFWKIISTCVRKGFIRNKTWYKSKKSYYQQYPYRPEFFTILEDDLKKLPAAVQKWFGLDVYGKGLVNGVDWRGRKHYKNQVPHFYWETKLVRSYITRVKLIDVDLKKEEAELDAQIAKYRYEFNDWWSGHVPKYYMMPYKRGYRRNCRQIVKQIAKGIHKEIPPLKETYGRAKWDYW